MNLIVRQSKDALVTRITNDRSSVRSAESAKGHFRQWANVSRVAQVMGSMPESERGNEKGVGF